MMTFDEKDIKAVARSRFWTKYQRLAVAWLFLALGSTVAIVLLTKSDWLLVVPLVLFIVGFGWFWWRQSKWEERLVESWKST